MADIKALKKDDTKLNSILRTNLIDSLLNIRLTLTVKKIISDKIERKELQNIVLEEMSKSSNEEVKSAINDVFVEYFDKKMDKTTGENVLSNNDKLSIDDMNFIINSRINDKHTTQKNQMLIKEFKPNNSSNKAA